MSTSIFSEKVKSDSSIHATLEKDSTFYCMGSLVSFSTGLHHAGLYSRLHNDILSASSRAPCSFNGSSMAFQFVFFLNGLIAVH